MNKKMNKLLLSIKTFISFIINKIDKYIVIPITKFFLYVGSFLENNGKFLEKWLTKKNTLIFISMFLALGIFLLVDSKTIVLVETSAEVLYNQPVSAIYNEESYVIEGLPKTVDVTLIGRKADLYFAKQLPTKDITIDLSNLKPGSHKVSLKYKQSLTSIDYKIDPSEALIMVYPKLSDIKPITIDVLNKDKLDPKLTINNIKLDREEIIIKGAEHNLKNVATVKALIDINKLANQAVGEILLKDVPLIAYDNTGQVIDVEIVPTKLNATITIDSPSKELPIKVIPTGDLAVGKAISSLEASVKTVTVYGDRDTLDKLTYIPVKIDVNNVKDNKEYNVVLERPNGVRYISNSTVNVKMSLDLVSQKEIENIFIEYKNLPSNYKVQAFDEASIKTTVIIKGVSSVIETLDPTSIKAYVDLSGLAPGEQDITIIVEGNDLRLTYLPKTLTVRLKISTK